MTASADRLLPYMKVVHEYIHLEFQVCRILTKFCSPFCSHCINCCCKEKFCNESLGSFWLTLVWQNSGCELLQYEVNSGWLTSNGCRLVAGRPPVCYSFICNEISDNLAKSDYLKILRSIAKLMPLAGKNSIGSKHLVTLSTYEVLELLDLNRLSKHIEKCLNLLEQYKKELTVL